MNIDDRVRVCMLLDFYGSLLTERQLVIAKRYFEDDASLAEIANELGISRQGVLDALKTSRESLEVFEQKLSLVERHAELKSRLLDIISDVELAGSNADILQKLRDLIQYL